MLGRTPIEIKKYVLDIFHKIVLLSLIAITHPHLGGNLCNKLLELYKKKVKNVRAFMSCSSLSSD